MNDIKETPKIIVLLIFSLKDELGLLFFNVVSGQMLQLFIF